MDDGAERERLLRRRKDFRTEDEPEGQDDGTEDEPEGQADGTEDGPEGQDGRTEEEPEGQDGGTEDEPEGQDDAEESAAIDREIVKLFHDQCEARAYERKVSRLLFTLFVSTVYCAMAATALHFFVEASDRGGAWGDRLSIALFAAVVYLTIMASSMILYRFL